MIRTITGYHQDETNDWVAELSCLHCQHMRHRPPFQDRAWVLDDEGRNADLGTAINCSLCARAEFPVGLALLRSIGPFDETSLPKPLQRAHRIGEAQWGLLRVLGGRLRFHLETDPDTPLTDVMLDTGFAQPIPPGAVHFVSLLGPCSVVLDFYGRSVVAK